MKKKQPKHVQEIYTHPIHEILKKRGHKQCLSLFYFFGKIKYFTRLNYLR